MYCLTLLISVVFYVFLLCTRFMYLFHVVVLCTRCVFNKDVFRLYMCIEMEDICIVDCATTHTILQSQKYFSQLTKTNSHVWTVSGTSNIIEGFGKASFILPNKTLIHIQEALYSSKSTRNLLSFKDIRLNGFHVETTNENEKEYFLITSNTC